MELTLPSKLNASETIVLDTNVLVVIGANGAGKSSFGRDLLERYSDNIMMIECAVGYNQGYTPKMHY